MQNQWLPLRYAAIIGLLAGLATGGQLWYRLQASSGEVLLYALEAGVLAGGAAFLLLHFGLFRQIRQTYEELNRLRSPKHPVSPETAKLDPLTGLKVTTHELTGQLQSEIEELRELEAVRREFLGDVSHELKTPIFAIQGFLETLLDGALEDPKVNRKFVTQALNNAHRLGALVQDLLVVTSLEAGQLPMNQEAVRLYEVVLDVTNDLQQLLEKQAPLPAIHLIANGLEKADVLADRDRLRQILTNLLDNAIRYGAMRNAQARGEVRIVLVADEPGRIRTHIIDNGPGIPEKDQQRVFQRFYRLDKSRARHLGGTGLGLSIVKNLLAAHNEEIQLTSRPGYTEFSFALNRLNG
jgi:two-component system phosphate regulon sensor histidine kinase PhoR